jgi:hypothetical protein
MSSSHHDASGVVRADRVIALIDMDCFYAQVEQRLQPALWGKPVAVVQYNQYKGGGYGRACFNSIYAWIAHVLLDSRALQDNRGELRGACIRRATNGHAWG